MSVDGPRDVPDIPTTLSPECLPVAGVPRACTLNLHWELPSGFSALA